MKSSSLLQEKLHSYRRERWLNMGRLGPFLLSSMAVTFIFSFFILYPPNPFKAIPKGDLDQRSLFIKPQEPQNDDVNSLEELSKRQNLIKPLKDDKNLVEQTQEKENSNKQPRDDEKCDFFKGHWVPDLKGSLYTNTTCPTIPISKNCFMHGRPDRDFLNWRWQPDACNLARFNPKTFLEMVRGKKMTFIGDSVARNHLESLLCLLSQEETPTNVYKDAEERDCVWYFPNHEFTLSTIWTRFLVAGGERMSNGSGTGVFDLHLDKVDGWAKDLPTIDIAIISAAHWFFRPIILHKSNKIIGCIFCNEPNVTYLDASVAVKMVYQSTFKHVNNCKDCKSNLVTLLRTFSPAHFENGTWNTGGGCKRRRPVSEEEIDLDRDDMKMRSAQVEELERARKEGEKQGKKFGVLDITRAMLMRPDGHPHAYWGNKWMKGYNDCVHWCMPGPIDAWSDFLMAVLRRLQNLYLPQVPACFVQNTTALWFIFSLYFLRVPLLLSFLFPLPFKQNLIVFRFLGLNFVQISISGESFK